MPLTDPMTATISVFDRGYPERTVPPGPEGVFLDGLSATSLERLERASGTTAYTRGAVIFHEGAPAHGVYIVRRGRPALALNSRSGKRLVLKSARVGDILGLSACLLGKPHAMSLESRGPCTLSFVPKHVFLRLMRADNELCFRAALHLSGEADHFCRGIDLMGLTRSAEQKLTAFFLQLFAETNAALPQSGDSIRLRLSHQELAHRVGVARETVTRALRRLRRAGAIELDGTALFFRDPALLRRIERGSRLRAPQHARKATVRR